MSILYGTEWVMLKSKLGEILSNGNFQKVIAPLECFNDFVDFHLLMTKYK